MAHRHGLKARSDRAKADQADGTDSVDDVSGGWINPLGFVLLTGAAVVLLAGVVLMPAYADYLEIRHERLTLDARNADMHAQLAVGERIIAAAGDDGDPNFMRRLAISQGEFIPTNQVAVASSGRTAFAGPDVVTPDPVDRPDPPPVWQIQIARKLSRQGTRRGMLLLSAGLLVVAGLIFHGSSSDSERA